MSFLLAFDNPLEYIMRYTVVAGMIIAAFGVALVMSAKAISKMKTSNEGAEAGDKAYSRVLIIGWCLILVGMLVTVIPYDKTFYVG